MDDKDAMDWFAGDVAARYDGNTASISGEAALGPMLDVLEELADGGPVLEFAIGTGRVALPLAARGVRVAGIEYSPDMLAQLRAKPGGSEQELPATLGDMATVRTADAGTYRLVYLVFNTVMNLTTQDAQVACFRNAADHLAPGGCFVIEVGIPALRRLPPGERFVLFDRSDDHIGIDEYDPATQRMWSHHTTFEAGGRAKRLSVPFRYVWPAELDLMARLAGMRLVHRWSGWDRSAFTSESDAHVSVWEKASS